MPLAERAGVLAGAGATFRSRDPVAVRLPRLAFLPDQGAGNRGHLPDTSLKNRESSSAEVGSWCSFLAQPKNLPLKKKKEKEKKNRRNNCLGSTSFSTKCHRGQIILPVPGIIALQSASFFLMRACNSAAATLWHPGLQIMSDRSYIKHKSMV